MTTAGGRTANWFTQGDRRVRPSSLDVTIAVVVFLGILGAQIRLNYGPAANPDKGHHLVAVVLLGALASGLLIYRRRRPMLVLCLTPVLLLAATALDAVNPAFTAIVAVAMFTVADQTNRHFTVLVGVVTAGVLYTGVTLHSEHGWDNGANLGILGWVGLAAAAGDASRNRRGYIAEVEERARKAEAERDTEAARRVTEERLRIARELHDVLAHHIAVIHVHAGLATATVESAPQTSKESLGHVRHAASDVLGELSALMQVLRSGDDEVPVLGSPDAPAPGLLRLNELIDNYRRSGAQITVTATGRVFDLPPAADLAAYRIIQEALTNADKHGVNGTTELTMCYTEDHLELRVRNLAANRPAGPGTGHGLIGMRERAASVGADLSHGPDREYFQVEARFAATVVSSEGISR
ncbi:two-component sensor histidine kinase [Nakamurella silvestris]|nr:two-component sensor histidine kinase [Nakamurella silvestris]